MAVSFLEVALRSVRRARPVRLGTRQATTNRQIWTVPAEAANRPTATFAAPLSERVAAPRSRESVRSPLGQIAAFDAGRPVPLSEADWEQGPMAASPSDLPSGDVRRRLAGVDWRSTNRAVRPVPRRSPARLEPTRETHYIAANALDAILKLVDESVARHLGAAR